MDELYSIIKRQQPLGRMTTTREVGYAVLFLASDEQAAVGAATTDRFAGRLGNVWEVDRVRAVRAKILDAVTGGPQQGNDRVLEWEAGVVVTND